MGDLPLVVAEHSGRPIVGPGTLVQSVGRSPVCQAAPRYQATLDQWLPAVHRGRTAGQGRGEMPDD